MFVKIVLLQLLCNSIILITAQWCATYRSVIKTSVQWNNGHRMVSKRNFFGGIKYKYEPYMYSTVQNYHDYERVSVCCDGYSKVSDTKCEPICNPSCPTNSHCMRPNICECDTTYRGYSARPNEIQCKPICLPDCAKNAECIAPNQCKCGNGYEDNGSGECQPICTACQENSSCTKPNECTCNAGYLVNDLGECKPTCSKQCPYYSECTKPETCTCQEHYKMKDDKCLPICDQKCPQNAQCIKPNECDCETGYEKIEQTNSTMFKCLAKCVKDCAAHSECVQPNVCECQQGYNSSQKNECEPVCENKCPLHATCSEPNKCLCDKGYEMLEQQCQPICEKACPEHSRCSEPNKCLCEAGYQLKLSSKYNLFCEPVCLSNCSSFGKCVQPNKCECLEGYDMDEMEVCTPICSGGCSNGLCFQPEVCICKPGYLMGPQEECEPACSMPCQNASCIEPEICQCYEGFRFQENSINICEPVCETQCINGICVAPNVCICNENFEPTTTEDGLNHSHCKLIQTTTTVTEDWFEETTTASQEFTETEKVTKESKITPSTTEFSSTLYPDQLRQTSASSLQSADICHESCQCWQEIDEYGPLVSKQCSRICVDAFDKPCLDLKLCQCDVAKNQLVCHIFEDFMEDDDDPIFYMCTLQRLKATTLKPLEEGKSSDMKIVQPNKETSFPWWWPAIVGVLVIISALGGLLYVRFKKIEDPIMEYEL